MQNLISQLKEGGANIILQVSADDLKEVMRSFYQDEQARTEDAIRKHREQPTLSRKDVAKQLGVSLATLWKWATTGYLVPVKIGTKVLYRSSDVEAILNNKQH